MFQHPRDIGYETEGYDLPDLNIIQHTVGVDYDQNDLSTLFPMEAHTMQERITARKETISERVDKCAELISSIDDYAVIWCNLNAESEAIAKALDDTVELKGSLTDDRKEAILRDFSRGNIKRLVTKASISGFGMNWQHCHNTAFLGLNDSYEQVYQAIRRFYRFGQKHAVNAHFIAAETEGQVVKNIERKEKQFLEMQSKMIEHMKDLNEVNAHGSLRNKTKYENTINMKLPTWIGG
jgi:superfamily II DNA/RNA helicase